jgi:hypothetical protein
MKRTKALENKILEELRRHGIVQSACDKHGISRQTFYRWMKEDREFLEQANEAISLGTGVVGDVALSNVLEGIKRKDAMYTKYWLSHRHPDFRRPFVHKVDAEDLIAHFRATQEALRQEKIDNDIYEATARERNERHTAAEAEVDKWIDGWTNGVEQEREDRSRELFEEWKKEYESKNKRPRKRPLSKDDLD